MCCGQKMLRVSDAIGVGPRCGEHAGPIGRRVTAPEESPVPDRREPHVFNGWWLETQQGADRLQEGADETSAALRCWVGDRRTLPGGEAPLLRLPASGHL